MVERRGHARFLIVVIPILITSCGDAQANAGGEPSGTSALPVEPWAVSSVPSVEIGQADGDDAYLFQDIVSVAVLGNGNVAVLDAGPAQLRFYDGQGAHLRTTGRKGGGPGEYRAPARVYRTHADTLLVFDSGSGMETVVDTSGGFVRATPFEPTAEGPFKRDAWLWRRMLIDGPRLVEHRGAVARALERLPVIAAADSFQFVQVDGFGRLWTRREPHDPEQPSTWHVFGPTGEPLGVVSTPARFQLQDIGAAYLAGRGWDEVGVERVQVFAYDAPQPSAVEQHGEIESVRPSTEMPEAILTGMRGLLRHATSQQEIFYSKGYRYASSAEQLEWPSDMEGYTVHIMGSGPRGYTMLIFHESAPGICGIKMGMGGPVGWTPGIVHCS